MGARSAYKPEYAEVARNAAERGATQHEIGAALGVTDRTVRSWAALHDGFASALKAGTEVADQRVEASLYHRAVGYSHEAVKLQVVNGEVVKTAYVEHHAPDTTAAIFWLKNRRPDVWRDVSRQEHTGAGGAPIATTNRPDLSGLTDEQLRVLAAIPVR